MRKLIKLFAVAALTACVACFSSATTILDTGFKASDTPSYSDADLAGQNGWTAVANTGANAFQVTDASVTGFATTVGTTLDITNGNFVYRSAPISGAVSNELEGSLDFTLDSTTTLTDGGGDIIRLGISSTVNTNLNALDTNQVYLSVYSTATGILRIRAASDLAGAPIVLCDMPAAEAGWGAGELPLPASDLLRLTWKIRKTAAADTYSLSASLTNLVNSSTNATGNTSVVKPGAYAAGSPYFVMGHPAGAFSSNNLGTLHITLDALSITNNTDLPPTLFPGTVTAYPGSAQVGLIWSRVAEAETYDIKRSSTTSTGTYTTITTGLPGSQINYTDVSVTNGEAYWYKLTAKATGATDADSAPILAEPNAPKTGLIFDTSFTPTNYVAGDLAGQKGWKSITASGAPAFYVDPTGNGFADTTPYSNYFNEVTGNQVYYNQIMSNGVGAAWSGTSVFTLKATAQVEETKIKTNTVDDVVTVTTNTQWVADVREGRVFELGLTSDPNIFFAPRGDESTMITLRPTGNAGVNVLLTGYNATDNLMIEIPRANLGWDPEWDATNATPDFETDPITLNWTIRKTASNLVYSGTASVTVGTNSYSGGVKYTTVAANQPAVLYPAELARFAMSHSFNSQTNSTNTMVNISIDSLSLSHSNDAPLLIAAPFGLSDTIGNTNITLGWQGALEASSFDIYRSVNYGNTNYVLRATVTNVWSYLDTNLTNLMLYNYKVVAKYAATNATSTNASFRARGKVDLLVWDAVGKVVGDTAVSQTNQVVVTNGSGGVVCNFYGNYTNGAIVGQGLGTYSGIPVYGVTQLTGSTAIVQYRMRTTFFDQTTQKNGDYRASNVCSSLMYIIATNGPINMATGVFTYEMKNDVAPATLRAAFRDSASGKWYVSHNNVDTNGLANGATSVGIDNMADPTNRWRELSIVQDNLMCGTNNPITVPSFASVDAIGFMMERTQQNLKTTLLKISSVSPLPTFTISNITTDVRGSITNNTSTPTNNPLVVNYGDSPAFDIEATNGFRIATVKTGGVDAVGITFSNESTKATFTWTNVTANGTLAATFTERFYTLAVTNGTGGGVYTNGTVVDIVASNAPAGQVFTYWTGNTNTLITTNVFAATNKVVMGTRNIQLTANYAIPTYQLIVNLGTGDSWNTNGTPVTIVANDPDPGQVFLAWTGNTEVLVSNTASTTFSTTNYTLTLTATYGLSSVTLTGTAGSGGTISPASTNVAIGTNVTFVITANTDYRISTLTKNGTDVPGVTFSNLSTSYNFIWTNVQAAGTASVSFVAQTTTVSTVPFVPVAVPYSWLRMQGITNNQEAAVALDQDGDGVKTWAEWIAGTVPTNSLSLLKATQTAARSNLNVITWNSVTGRLYQVYWSTNLVKGFALKQDNITYLTNNATASYTNATPDSRLNHYQVRVRFQ